MTTYTNYNISIYNHSNDKTSINISEDGDGCEMVVVKADTDFYGKIDFSMDLEVAEKFARGILKQIEFIKENKE